jgi:transposase
VLAQLVTAQVQLLRTLQATIGELEKAIKLRVVQHPRAKLLHRLPGVGTINLAQLLAEVGPILDRVSNAEQAAAECGAVPVTRASGKTSGVYFRWAADIPGFMSEPLPASVLSVTEGSRQEGAVR